MSRLASGTALGLALAALCGAPQAATLTVTNSNDSGPGSLRAAILAANAGDPDEPQQIEFALGVDGITGATPLPPLQHPDISLRGAGGPNGVPTLSGEDSRPLLRIEDTVARLALSDLILEAGRDSAGPGCLNGIGMLNSAQVEIDRVSFLECRQLSDDTAVGGAMYLNGDVRIRDSRIEQSLAIGTSAAAGGGIAFGAGSLLIERSVIADNRATGANPASALGGGIAMIAPGSFALTIRDSRVAQNSAGQGGGIFSRNAETSLLRSGLSANTAEFGSGLHAQALNGAFVRLSLESSTVIGNHADQRGALHVSGGTAALRLRNVSFLNNSAGSATADLAGAHLSLSGARLQSVHSSLLGPVGSLVSGGPTAAARACVLNTGPGSNPFVAGNIAADASCTALAPQINAGDLAALGLGPLQQTDVGVLYHPVLPGSLLLDAGVATASAPDPFNTCAPFDVRRSARPDDGNLDGTPRCDIGAYELNTTRIFGNGFE